MRLTMESNSGQPVKNNLCVTALRDGLDQTK